MNRSNSSSYKRNLKISEIVWEGYVVLLNTLIILLNINMFNQLFWPGYTYDLKFNTLKPITISTL